MDEARSHQPDDRSARMRHIAQANKNELEALIDCAGCDNCAFRNNDECRAWPPRARLIDGEAVAVWPKIKMTDWCGCYRQI